MANINLEIKKALERKLKQKVDLKNIKNNDLKIAGNSAVDAIKKLVSKGISPIKENQRFERYKNPDRYPGDRKKRRPVNLKLTGKFLKGLIAKAKSGKQPNIRLGFFDKYGKTLEQGHREGANSQPKRPIIPTGDQEFKPQIMKQLKDHIIKAMEKSLK